MNWIKAFSMTYLALSMLVGCALSPQESPVESENESREQTEERLRERFRQAVTLMKSGEAEAAEARFTQLMETYSGHTGPLANLGLLAFERGDLEKASAYFRDTLELDPGHLVALNQLGVIARHQGNFEAAERNYRRALAVEPEFLPAMLNLAFLLDIYLGRPAEALAFYEQYQSLADEPDPRIDDWIFDTRNRL